MIKAEFREDVLDASATLDRLTSASLVRVDDLDAVAGPAERDGHVGQRISRAVDSLCSATCWGLDWRT